MGRQINNSKSKRVAHTQHDNRYNRGNKVTMIKCPKCCATSTLKIFSERKKVWAACSNCNSSGYNAKIDDHHLIEAIDIVSTIVDAED
jgi:transcription elongation factor Elf1